MKSGSEITLITSDGSNHILAGLPIIWHYWELLESLEDVPKEFELLFKDVTLPDGNELAGPISGAHRFSLCFDDQGPLNWTLYADPLAQEIRLVIEPADNSDQQKNAVQWMIVEIESLIRQARELTDHIRRSEANGTSVCAAGYNELRRKFCIIPTET